MSNILTENLRSTDEVTSSSASYLHSNAVIESEKTKDTCLLYSNEACFDLQFSEIIPLTSNQFDFLDTIVSDMDNDTAFDDIVSNNMISNVHAPMDVNNSHIQDTVGNQHIFQNQQTMNMSMMSVRFMYTLKSNCYPEIRLNHSWWLTS